VKVLLVLNWSSTIRPTELSAPTTLLSDGAHRSSIEELAEWTEWAEKVVTF